MSCDFWRWLGIRPCSETKVWVIKWWWEIVPPDQMRSNHCSFSLVPTKLGTTGLHPPEWEKMDAYDMKLLKWWHEYWLNAPYRPANANANNTIERCTTFWYGLFMYVMCEKYEKCTGAQGKVTRPMERLAQNLNWQHSWFVWGWRGWLMLHKSEDYYFCYQYMAKGTFAWTLTQPKIYIPWYHKSIIQPLSLKKFSAVELCDAALCGNAL